MVCIIKGDISDYRKARKNQEPGDLFLCDPGEGLLLKDSGVRKVRDSQGRMPDNVRWR